MIITERKPEIEIQDSIGGQDNFIILGCARCATSCQTGGEKQVNELAEQLRLQGKNVIGCSVLDPPCDERVAKLKLCDLNVAGAGAILGLVCGSGIASISDVVDLPVHPMLNTLFLGTAKRAGVYDERCSMCGNCVLDKTHGICPVTRCSKGLLNGPCGGSIGGKCEVDQKKDCGWVLIYDRLKKKGDMSHAHKIHHPKDYRYYLRPQVIDKTKRAD